MFTVMFHCLQLPQTSKFPISKFICCSMTKLMCLCVTERSTKRLFINKINHIHTHTHSSNLWCFLYVYLIINVTAFTNISIWIKTNDLIFHNIICETIFSFPYYWHFHSILSILYISCVIHLYGFFISSFVSSKGYFLMF